MRQKLLRNANHVAGVSSLIGVVAVVIVAGLTWSTFADDTHESADRPVVEATIPDTLHPNDFALIPADRAIVARVRATLVVNPFVPVDADNIAVQARRGKVTLLGFVRSQGLKQELSMRVPLIPGVEALDNQVVVTPEDEHTR